MAELKHEFETNSSMTASASGSAPGHDELDGLNRVRPVPNNTALAPVPALNGRNKAGGLCADGIAGGRIAGPVRRRGGRR
jgi:hypothetical protein